MELGAHADAPTAAGGLSHPREHKGSHLHCRFQAPHCSPCGGACVGGGGAATSPRQDKGDELGSGGARILSPSQELFPRGTALGNGTSDRCQGEREDWKAQGPPLCHTDVTGSLVAEAVCAGG